MGDSMALGQETSFGLLYHLETSELFLQLHLGIIKKSHSFKQCVNFNTRILGVLLTKGYCSCRSNNYFYCVAFNRTSSTSLNGLHNWL